MTSSTVRDSTSIITEIKVTIFLVFNNISHEVLIATWKLGTTVDTADWRDVCDQPTHVNLVCGSYTVRLNL